MNTNVVILDGGPEDGREFQLTFAAPAYLSVPERRVTQLSPEITYVWTATTHTYLRRGTDRHGRTHYLYQPTLLNGSLCRYCGHWPIDHRYAEPAMQCHQCPNGLCEPREHDKTENPR